MLMCLGRKLQLAALGEPNSVHYLQTPISTGTPSRYKLDISTDSSNLRQYMEIKEETGGDFCCTRHMEALNSFCYLRFLRERPNRRGKK